MSRFNLDLVKTSSTPHRISLSKTVNLFSVHANSQEELEAILKGSLFLFEGKLIDNNLLKDMEIYLGHVIDYLRLTWRYNTALPRYRTRIVETANMLELKLYTEDIKKV